MKNQRKIIFNQKAFKCYRDKGFKEPYHENEVGWFDFSFFQLFLNNQRLSFYLISIFAY